jgi:hypothetical protein
LTYSSGVAPTESHETARKFNTIIGQCKHCNRNDHRRKSNALCPFFERKLHSSTATRTINDDQLPVVDTEPAYSQKINICIHGDQHWWFAWPRNPGQSNRGK